MSVEFSLFFSSVWFLLTTFRAMIAGWGINIFTDLFHRFCTAKVKMICFGQSGVGYRFNPLMFATIPDVRGESEELYTSTFQVFTQGLQYFVTHFQYCGNATCSTCAHIRSILLHPEISQYIASRDFLQEFPNIPIRSFSSDNCSGFLKLVRTMWLSGEVVALVCSAHLTGKYASIPFLEARLMFLIAVVQTRSQLQSPQEVSYYSRQISQTQNNHVPHDENHQVADGYWRNTCGEMDSRLLGGRTWYMGLWFYWFGMSKQQLWCGVRMGSNP